MPKKRNPEEKLKSIEYQYKTKIKLCKEHEIQTLAKQLLDCFHSITPYEVFDKKWQVTDEGREYHRTRYRIGNQQQGIQVMNIQSFCEKQAIAYDEREEVQMESYGFEPEMLSLRYDQYEDITLHLKITSTEAHIENIKESIETWFQVRK